MFSVKITIAPINSIYSQLSLSSATVQLKNIIYLECDLSTSASKLYSAASQSESMLLLTLPCLQYFNPLFILLKASHNL